MFTRGSGDQFTLKNEAGHCIDFFCWAQKFGTYTCHGGANQKHTMDSEGRICGKSCRGSPRCFSSAKNLRTGQRGAASELMQMPMKAQKPAGPSWTKHDLKSSGGYAAGVWQSFKLEDAKAKCGELGDRCAAVTCKGAVCTVRGSKALGYAPRETTYLKGKPVLLEEFRAGSSMVPELLDAAPLSHMRCAGPPDVDLGTGPEEDCQQACNAHRECHVALWKQKYWHCMGYVHCDPIAKPGQQFKAWRKVPLALLETPQLQLGRSSLPAAHAQVVVGFDLPDRSPGDRVNILLDGVIVASEMLPDKLVHVDSTRAGTVRLVLNPDVSPDVQFLGARYTPVLPGQYAVQLESSTARPHGLVSLELLSSAPTQPGQPRAEVRGGHAHVKWTPPAYAEGDLRYAVYMSSDDATVATRVAVTSRPEVTLDRAELSPPCRLRVRAAHHGQGDDAWSQPSHWSDELL